MSDKRIFTEQATSGLDLNAASVTAALDMRAYRRVSFQVVLASGTIGATVTTVQVSNDGTNWASTSTTLTGVGEVSAEIRAKFVRLAVTTPAGGAATGDISAIAKS